MADQNVSMSRGGLMLMHKLGGESEHFGMI